MNSQENKENNELIQNENKSEQNQQQQRQNNTIEQNNEVNLQTSRKEQLIQEKKQLLISFVHKLRIITMIFFLYLTLYTQYICMVRSSCNDEGIEINSFIGVSIPIVSLATGITTSLTLLFGKKQIKSVTSCMKLFNISFIVLIVIFAITSFFLQINYAKAEDIQDTWSILSYQQKEYYSNDINNLQSINLVNLNLAGIHFVVIAIIYFIQNYFLWVIDQNLVEIDYSNAKPLISNMIKRVNIIKMSQMEYLMEQQQIFIQGKQSLKKTKSVFLIILVIKIDFNKQKIQMIIFLKLYVLKNFNQKFQILAQIQKKIFIKKKSKIYKLFLILKIMSLSPNDIGKQFCQAYYTTMQTNKANLGQFYDQNSIMNFNGSTAYGIKEILEKIESFSFEKIAFQIDDMDVQMSAMQGSILIFVVGQMQMDNDSPFKFSQVFLIVQNGKGGYYCHNDILKFVF